MITENFYAMLNEIKEQPELLRQLYSRREELTADFVKLVTSHPIKRIYFTGCGSPLFVSKALIHAASKLLGAEASASPAMLFNHHEGFHTDAFKPEEMLLICPAESGMGKGGGCRTQGTFAGYSGGVHHVESGRHPWRRE